MKKITTLFATLMLCISAFAQGEGGYVQAKNGSRVRYAFYCADKLRLYIDRTATTVDDGDGKQTVTHLYTMLNKKGKPSKSAALAGFGDGLQTAITLTDGSYYLTFDFFYGSSGEDRSGYLLKIPQTLKVGDELEGGTLKSVVKFLGSSYKNNITFSGFKVTEEVDLTTPGGTFHCLKLTGTVTGRSMREDINEVQTIYLAPGIGIVRQEALAYMGTKTSYVVEVTEVEGL